MSDLSPTSDTLLSWWLTLHMTAPAHAPRLQDALEAILAANRATERDALDDLNDDDWMWRSEAAQVKEKRRLADRRARKLAYKRQNFERLVETSRYSVLHKALNRRCGEPWTALLTAYQRHFTGKRFQQDIFDHLLRDVSHPVTLYEELPHVMRGGQMRDGLYACPLSGLLKRLVRVNTNSSNHRRKRRRHPCPVNLPNAGGQVHWLANGARGPGWYLLTLAPLPPRALWAQTRDVVLGQTLAALDRTDCVPALLQSALFVAGMYAQSARWVTPQELLKHGLRDRRQRRMTRNNKTFRRAHAGQSRCR